MKKLTLLTLLLLVVGNLNKLEARIWTSKNGKKINAEFISLEDSTVSLKMKGKVYKLALNKLSDEDQEFAKEQQAKRKNGEDNDQEASPSTEETNDQEYSLKGVKLIVGKRVDIEFDLNDAAKKALSKNKLKPTKCKLAIVLPKNFNPHKPQKVFWAVGGINNEQERLSGNIGRVQAMTNEAHKRGWIVIAADTDHGNPRETTIAKVKGDLEFHQQVIEEISKEWSGFKGWQHACGGFSSGSKASFFRTAQLLKSKVNVVGMFLGGCNGAYAQAAADETRVSKGSIRKVSVWLSHGTTDNLVNAKYTNLVLAGLKKGGYRKVRSESYAGGHSLNQAEFGKALDWFVNPS